MTGGNPQSQVPGGWSRDSPAVEQNNPVDEAQQSVPRTEGTVSESGDILDNSGNAIGKLPESKDPKELAGNTVTTAGEIVNDSGEVLGKVSDNNDEENSEYTTKAVEEGDSSSGYNLLGKTKGMFGFGGSQKGKDAAGDAAEQAQDATNDSKDKAEEGQDDAPVNLEDNDKSVEDRAQNAGDDAQEALDSKDETTGDVKDKAEETTDDAQKNAEDTTQETTEDAQKTAEETTDDAQKTAEETTDDAQKNAEETTDETQKSAEETADDAKDAVEGDKPAEEQQDGEEGDQIDFSILKGTKVNKAGNLVNEEGKLVGRVTEGEVKQLVGKRADENGDIWNDSGKKVGKGEPLPESERETNKTFAPFENFPDAVVEADGTVVSEGKRVGTVVDGDAKKLKGSKVDEDGDILDRNGNVVGKAEPYDEPEPVEEEAKDQSLLAGKRVNKGGNIVSSSGEIFGRVVEGDASKMVGRMCDKNGNILSESGDILGRAELIPEGEREGYKEGPFAELSGCTVAKDGTVVTPSGDIVGRLTQGDGKTLFGRSVDEDGDVVDRNGNTLGKAERWEPEEEEKKKGPMAGRKVNRDGNILDDDGNVMGKLISGDAVVCAGKEVDDDGDVINSKGQSIGHAALIEDIPQEPEPEESAEDKEKREQAEKDQKLAGQLSGCIEQSLDKVRPICKMITDKIEKADRTPKEELDEEELVKQVKPLIEEGGKILTETNGVIRGLDPDGRIQRNAKHKSGTKEASPEEHHLAEVLKELTGTVTQTIDKAKNMIEDMPHAKKELNPLWGLLSEPLGQIIAAVGLLLNGVLGILGRLLGGLGLGNLLEGLLGSLGLDKVLDGLGLGSVTSSLTGKK